MASQGTSPGSAPTRTPVVTLEIAVEAEAGVVVDATDVGSLDTSQGIYIPEK